jgi:hypothetical protein
MLFGQPNKIHSPWIHPWATDRILPKPKPFQRFYLIGGFMKLIEYPQNFFLFESNTGWKWINPLGLI